MGMELTLSVEDFKRLSRIPSGLVLRFGAQYTIMPLLGWAIGGSKIAPRELINAGQWQQIQDNARLARQAAATRI
jgi:predicted Na+-dependent transporter